MERREHERVNFGRQVRVGRFRDLAPMLAGDISEGGLFLKGFKAAVGDEVTVEFEADELPGVRFRAVAEVVRILEGPDAGVGARFREFEEGGSDLVRLIKFLLDPKNEKPDAEGT